MPIKLVPVQSADFVNAYRGYLNVSDDFVAI